MIKKIHEQWGEVEQTARNGASMSTEELQNLLRSIVGVKDALRQMCDVNVTRATLRDAVRVELVALLEKHGREIFREIFGEIESLRDRVAGGEAAPHAPHAPAKAGRGSAADMEAVVDEVRAQLDNLAARLGGMRVDMERVETRVQEFQSAVEAMEGKVSGVDERLGRASTDLEELSREVRENLQGLQGRLDDADDKYSSGIGDVRESIEEQLRSGLLIVEDRLEKTREHLTGLLAKLEAAVPDEVRRGTGELEARIRQEIDSMVRELSEKLSELHAVLGRMDQRFEKVSTQVDSIDSVTPDLRGLEGKFAALREQLAGISTGVGEAGQGLSGLRESVGANLAELRAVVDEGIRRWESDQSGLFERLSAIRDSLRDQLRAAGEHVTEKRKSVWGKITGKGEGGLKLSPEEWDQIAGRIDGVISGLESLLARRKNP